MSRKRVVVQPEGLCPLNRGLSKALALGCSNVDGFLSFFYHLVTGRRVSRQQGDVDVTQLTEALGRNELVVDVKASR